MSNGEDFKDRGPFPAQRKDLEDDIAQQKRVDVEGELRETKEDFDVSSFTNFVRGQNITPEELSDDDLSFFIRYGNLMGQGMGDETRIPKETRLGSLRDIWEKGRQEKIKAAKKNWKLGEY